MAQLEGSATEYTTFDELLHPLAATLQSIEDRRSPHHREVLTQYRKSHFEEAWRHCGFMTPLRKGR